MVFCAIYFITKLLRFGWLSFPDVFYCAWRASFPLFNWTKSPARNKVKTNLQFVCWFPSIRPESLQSWLITLLCLPFTLVSFHPFHPLPLPYLPVVARATALTCRPMFPWARGAIRGLSTSFSSCYKWCWRDEEGPRLCFEGQQGRSSALCQWLSGPSAATPGR